MQLIKNTQVRTAVLGLMLAVVILEFGRTTLGTFCIVDGTSMCPTLNPGDFVHARVSYVKARGDVVIVTDDSRSEAIKRIVGLPGEVVTLFGGEVYINGQRLLEPYLEEASCTFKNNQKNEPAAVWDLAADQYFVMGDNRCGSCDSRHYGPLPRSGIRRVVELPKNSPGPAFLEITLANSGKAIQNHHHRAPAHRNQVLMARRASRNQLRAFSEAVIR
jgi:signal peptidase I